MDRCLKISVSGTIPDNFVETIIQTSARQCGLEGTVQAVDAHHIYIVACGEQEFLDQFLDILHQRNKAGVDDIEIEPFLKAKDYRGVFRIIE